MRASAAPRGSGPGPRAAPPPRSRSPSGPSGTSAHSRPARTAGAGRAALSAAGGSRVAAARRARRAACAGSACESGALMRREICVWVCACAPRSPPSHRGRRRGRRSRLLRGLARSRASRWRAARSCLRPCPCPFRARRRTCPARTEDLARGGPYA
ncbi:hypothetical protein BC834DRAFT_880237 [Gloeopeniophorella convolvens]|nr:hypothetical protein BC834DRAFT_880237 [Gloeopeniophorella convolvens]